jgi:hypothetical protein
MFFGWREMKLRDEAADATAPPQTEMDEGTLAEQFRRYSRLQSAPRVMLDRIRRTAILKFSFCVLLVIEVVVLQR